jgi:hypothetical protein
VSKSVAGSAKIAKRDRGTHNLEAKTLVEIVRSVSPSCQAILSGVSLCLRNWVVDVLFCADGFLPHVIQEPRRGEPVQFFVSLFLVSHRAEPVDHPDRGRPNSRMGATRLV